jgi:hypothetical protein
MHFPQAGVYIDKCFAVGFGPSALGDKRLPVAQVLEVVTEWIEPEEKDYAHCGKAKCEIDCERVNASDRVLSKFLSRAGGHMKSERRERHSGKTCPLFTLYGTYSTRKSPVPLLMNRYWEFVVAVGVKSPPLQLPQGVPRFGVNCTW